MGYALTLLACFACSCLASTSSTFSHTLPPAHPPVKPPSHPPRKPPSRPPVKPPTHPPIKPPTYPPIKPPTYPPTKPPTYPPIKPPNYPPIKTPTRRLLAVRGVVYCKSCKYVGIPTLTGASPLSGAVVELVCKSSKKTEVTKGRTNAGGFFFIIPKHTSSFGAHKCKVLLVSSPLKNCSKPTNLNFGVTGSPLLSPKYENIGKAPYAVYKVGPFAYEGATKCR